MNAKTNNPSFQHVPHPCRVRGVGLIEVLVAVAVLAFGLLGIAALQATALRNSQSSYERSQAVTQTYSILDRMRANLNVVHAGGYDTTMMCDASDVPDDGGALAKNDLSQWLAGMKQIMGDNAGFIDSSRKCLQETLSSYGVQIQQFGLIGAPRPPDNVKAAINLKVQATQTALQKQNEVAQAEADAKKNVAQAEGDAASLIARAKGEAEANRIKSGSIDEKLIQWYRLSNQKQMIEKWNGEVSKVQTGNGGVLLQMPQQ